MKKTYVKPTINVENFAANEFIAACGDSGADYLFECNANSGGWFSDGGDVYVDSNKNGEYDRKRDKRLGGYSPCGETHKASSTDEFLDGFLVYDSPIPFVPDKIKKVIIWRGEDGHNIHCTTNLDKNSWETAKS